MIKCRCQRSMTQSILKCWSRVPPKKLKPTTFLRTTTSTKESTPINYKISMKRNIWSAKRTKISIKNSSLIKIKKLTIRTISGSLYEKLRSKRSRSRSWWKNKSKWLKSRTKNFFKILKNRIMISKPANLWKTNLIVLVNSCSCDTIHREDCSKSRNIQ